MAKNSRRDVPVWEFDAQGFVAATKGASALYSEKTAYETRSLGQGGINLQPPSATSRMLG